MRCSINRHLALLACAVFAFLLAGCSGGKPETASVELFFTSQTRGRLTHCGCFSGQYGGLARLRTALEARRPVDLVGVDVGDALEGTEDFHLLKHRQVLKAYAGLGYAALNAGAREAALPAEALRQLGAESPVPFISANLRERATGASLLKNWTITRRASLRVAFVGVVDPRLLPDGAGEGVEIEPMETCLARVLPELKGKADVLVLLAYADESALTALAGRFYEFAAVLGGAVSQPSQRLVQENRSLVYYTGNDAKSYGRLELRVARDGRVAAGAHDITLLTDQYPENHDILKLLADYRAESRAAKLDVDDPARALAGRVPGVRSASDYVGSPSCLGCHPSAAAVWQGTAHGHAFDSLVARGADADPSCIACHTVGFGSPGGYRREFADRQLTHVGCESCHGPGGRHVVERAAGGPVSFQFRPLGPGDCQKCHHGEFSRPFDFELFWPHIRHGKEPKT
jgi:Cytochrome c554 and c-prime